jgi:hypothetical protein
MLFHPREGLKKTAGKNGGRKNGGRPDLHNANNRKKIAADVESIQSFVRFRGRSWYFHKSELAFKTSGDSVCRKCQVRLTAKLRKLRSPDLTRLH